MRPADELAATGRRSAWPWVARALGGLVAAGFVALLAYGVIARSPDTTIDDNLARARTTPAPPFELAVLQRGRLDPRLGRRLAHAVADGRLALSELRGTPIVLNFWASWCLPCREEAPRLERGWRSARPRGVLFLGLNMQDVTEDARLFMRSFAIDYPNVRDPTNAVARLYGITGLPETFFISSTGEITGHVIGVVSPQQLKDGVAAAVTGRPHATHEGGARRPTR